MKRVIALTLLVGLTILCALNLVSCDGYLKRETEPSLLGGNNVYAPHATLDEAIQYYVLYYTDNGTSEIYDAVFFPQEGTFETDDGEAFISEVGECYLCVGSYDDEPTFCFELKIYDTDGNLVAEAKVNSCIDEETMGVKIQESFENVAKYWSAIAILPSNWLICDAEG